jgi:hypothetical protein
VLAADVEAEHKPSLEAAADILVKMPVSPALASTATFEPRNRPTRGIAMEQGRPTLLKASLTSLVVIALAVSTHYVYRHQAAGQDTRSADARLPSIPGANAGNQPAEPDPAGPRNTASAQRETQDDTGTKSGRMTAPSKRRSRLQRRPTHPPPGKRPSRRRTLQRPRMHRRFPPRRQTPRVEARDKAPHIHRAIVRLLRA